MVMHVFNPNVLETEANEFLLSSKPTWSTQQVPRLRRKTLSKRKRDRQKCEQEKNVMFKL